MTFRNQKLLCVVMTVIAASMMAIAFQLARIEDKLTPAVQPAPAPKEGWTLHLFDKPGQPTPHHANRNDNNQREIDMPKKKLRAKREIKPIGSAKARKQVREITKRVLAHVKKLTPTEAAPVLGVSVDDMRNMRQGNKFSVPMLFKMIRWGKFDATSIIEGPKLKKTRRPMSLTTTQHRLDGRIHTLAWDYPGKTLAEMTGMSVTGAYGLRYATDAHVTLYTVLGFVHAGHSIGELVFGQ